MDGVKKVQRGVLSSRLALIKAWQRHSCLGISHLRVDQADGEGVFDKGGEETEQDLFILSYKKRKKNEMKEAAGCDLRVKQGVRKPGVPLTVHTPCKLLSISQETCY